MFEIAWLLGGAALAVFLLDRLGLWAERRGWIYWRKRRGRSLGAGLLGGLTEVFQPNQIHYVREVQQEKKASHASGQGASPTADDVEEEWL